MSADDAAAGTGRDWRAGALTTVPPELVVGLRRGVYAELTMACEDAPQAINEAETRAGWKHTLRRIGAALEALDAIGWEESAEAQPVTIPVGPVFIEALEREVEHDHWIAELKDERAEGRARAVERAATVERFLASLPEHPTLVISRATIPLVRECAQEGIPVVAEAIDRTGLNVREGTRKLNAICDLLDAIGWTEDEEPAEDVDAAEHARAVKEVSPALLETLRTAVSDLADGDPAKWKAENELRLLTEIDEQATETLGG